MNEKGERSRPSVLILGAGIGGLTVAHVLSERGFQVTILERHDRVGGLCRSSFCVSNHQYLPTEYSWRVYGPGYHNLHRLLRNIPFDTTFPSHSVYDNLIDLEPLVASSATSGTVAFSGSALDTIFHVFPHLKSVTPWSDILQFTKALVRGFSANREELETRLTNISWRDFVGPLKSPYFEKWVVYSVAPILGEDLNRASAAAILSLLEKGSPLEKDINDRDPYLAVMNGPTQSQWLDPWQRHLQRQGARFYLNTEVVGIKITARRISWVKALVRNPANESISHHFRADHYVCALSVEVAAQLLSGAIPKLITLSQRGYQEMVCIQFYFDRRFEVIKNVLSGLPLTQKRWTSQRRQCAGALYIPSSPWQLVIELQGAIWDWKPEGIVRDVWSIGLDDTRTPGIQVQKPFTHCSKEEIAIEVWAQIMNCSELPRILRSPADGLPLTRARLVGWYLWDSYQFDRVTKRLTTWEPKFSDNVGTYEVAPRISEPSVSNMTFATGYAKGISFRYSMEKAATNGLLASNVILSLESMPPVEVIQVEPKSTVAKWMAALDIFF